MKQGPVLCAKASASAVSNSETLFAVKAFISNASAMACPRGGGKINTKCLVMSFEAMQSLNPSKVTVVKQNKNRRNVQPHDGFQFAYRHPEGTIPKHCQSAGAANLLAKSRRPRARRSPNPPKARGIARRVCGSLIFRKTRHVRGWCSGIGIDQGRLMRSFQRFVETPHCSLGA